MENQLEAEQEYIVNKLQKKVIFESPCHFSARFEKQSHNSRRLILALVNFYLAGGAKS
jgi:hypothetical protein